MKILVLFSGGLDSILAAKILQIQGIEVSGVHFITLFSNSLDPQDIIKKAEQLGIELKIIYLKEEFLEIIKNPRFGYGKNLNPCIDCKILMLKEAKKIMEQLKFSCIATGEVVGQRPKSQNKNTLRLIEKQAGLKDLVLRPLSAKLLWPTILEKENLIQRENFFAISGRSRKKQIELAYKFNIRDYSQPAGGCLLTDPNFSKKVKDLLDFNQLTIENVELLRIGRHFRLNKDCKLIVGRDQQENCKIYNLAKKEDLIFEPQNVVGPVGLLRGLFDDKIKILASRIISRYTKAKTDKVQIILRDFRKVELETLTVEALSEKEISEFMI